MYLNEHKLSKLSDAALMADEFALTGRGSTSHLNYLYNVRSKISVLSKGKATVAHQSVISSSSTDPAAANIRMIGEIVCFYCKRAGRNISDCMALKKKERFAKTVGLISTSGENHSPVQVVQNKMSRGMERWILRIPRVIMIMHHFLQRGLCLCLVPIRMFLFVSFAILGLHNPSCWKDFYPLSDSTTTGTHVLVRGFERGFVEVPLHRIHLTSRQVILSWEFVDCYLFLVLLLFLAMI